ncbi:MAG: leucine-rich repeat domain-containing protein [Promethearchaeota archaeon]
MSLSKLGVKSISELKGLSKCTELEELKLRFNKINEITDLESLTNLRTLDLSYNNITEIKGIEHLENLCSLNLSYNQINEVKNLDDLKKLESLDISGNNISKINGLEELHNLRILDLSRNKIKKIEHLNHLSNLTKLYLSDNKINKIENIDHLYNLMKLYLWNNKIKRIENLDQLNNLDTLNLDLNQQISKIENLQHLSKLKTLNLGGTSIEKIEGLDTLISLEQLGIGSVVKNYFDIEGLANLINLKELEIHKFYLWNESSHYQLWYKRPIQAFRFISMIKANDYKKIKDWKDLFINFPGNMVDFLCNNNSDYQMEWLYKQCSTKIIDFAEEILNEPEFEELRMKKEDEWKETLKVIQEVLFKPSKVPINWIKMRNKTSETEGDRIFCVYAKRPDCQLNNVDMVELLENINKWGLFHPSFIGRLSPMNIETSEGQLWDFKHDPTLSSRGSIFIKLDPSDDFKKFFKTEMLHIGKFKLKLRLFDYFNKGPLDANGTPLGTNFMILSIPFSGEIWFEYPLKDIIQDKNDYCGFFRTRACQIFEKKYEKFLNHLKQSVDEEIGTGFYVKKSKTSKITFSDIFFGKDYNSLL